MFIKKQLLPWKTTYRFDYLTMKGNFKTLLRKFCLEGTIHGLKYFYLYPDRLSRCFWTANMIAVLYLACVLCQHLYLRFAEMPTQITIENQYEPVSSMPYPAITICSPVQVTKSYMKKLNESLTNAGLQVDLETAVTGILGMYEILPDFNETTLFSLQSFLEHQNITTARLLGSTAQSCRSFLKLCYFETKRYENCEGLLQPILTAHGLCCTFNNKYFYDGNMNQHAPNAITRTVRSAGEGRGLIVIANYDMDDAVDGTILSGGAVKVMYSDSIDFPTNMEMTLVETYTESFHIINAEYTTCSEEVRTLLPEQRKCFLDHEASLPYFDKYSKSDCDLACVVQAVLEQCGCLLFYIPHASSHTCNMTNVPCIMLVKYSSTSIYSCNCLSDCEPRKYAADFILGNFNAVPYMLNQPYAGIQFNQSTLLLNFYFVNSMYVKKKQETVMSLPILASNLGGIFGLCLGCSCISVLEILFYTQTFIKNYINRRWQRDFVRFIEYKN